MKHMFYFLLALTAILTTTSNASVPVRDSDGDIITNGSYYVYPGIVGAGGGVNLAPLDGQECPLYVGQEDSDLNKGIPVRFSNWKSKVRFVPAYERLNIQMDTTKAPMCVKSGNWWKVAAPDAYGRRIFLGTGPSEEPGEDSKSSFFQIMEADRYIYSYIIAFCPNDNKCLEVGTLVDNYGVRRLDINSETFLVRFVKASKGETSSKTMSTI